MPLPAHWDPDQYFKFEDERRRPFEDLLARIADPGPKEVVDLGCGPGNTTAQLRERWPYAHIVGVDSSPEMVVRAKALEVPGRLEFRQQDILDWHSERPVDVLLSCATFQWVEGHVGLFPRFVQSLEPGGTFAFQVPNNFDEPSHILLHELATSDRWSDLLKSSMRSAAVLPPQSYLSALLDTGAVVDVWETTYLHVLQGPDAVLQWVQGTALRPFLTALERFGSPSDTEDFLASYAAGLRAAYQRDTQGRTVFPFRRIFAVAIAS